MNEFRYSGAVWALAVMLTSAAHAEPRTQLLLGQEYSCNGGQTRVIVKSCKRLYTATSCELQYLNAAAPSGLGALIDERQENLERNLAACTVGGKVAAVSEAATGRPGQAQRLGTWYDVAVLRQEGGEVRVRWAGGSEDFMPADKVRLAQATRAEVARPDSPMGTLKAGPYHCTSFVGPVTGGGHLVAIPGFTVVEDGTYVHQHGSRGRLTRGADGTATFQGGALSGQFAKYESSGGHAVLRIYNESRSRTVIDCEGPPA